MDRKTSLGRGGITLTIASAFHRMAKCDSITPFGRAVVPEL